MSKIRIEMPHRLPVAEALKRVKRLLNETKSQFADRIKDLKEEWDDNEGAFSMNVSGIEFAGTLRVVTGKVVIDGDLPFPASPFKGRIEAAIRAKAKELLA